MKHIENNNNTIEVFGRELRPVWGHPLWVREQVSRTGLTVSGLLPETVTTKPVFNRLSVAAEFAHKTGQTGLYFPAEAGKLMTDYNPSMVRVVTPEEVQRVIALDEEVMPLSWRQWRILHGATGTNETLLTREAGEQALEYMEWDVITHSKNQIVALTRYYGGRYSVLTMDASSAWLALDEKASSIFPPYWWDLWNRGEWRALKKARKKIAAKPAW